MFWVKWRHVYIAFGSDTSDIWLFRRMLNGVFALPILCVLHKVQVHSISYIKYFFFPIKVMEYRKAFSVFVTCEWWGVCHLFSAHVAFPIIKWVESPCFVDYLLFLTLSLTMVFPRKRSPRFCAFLNESNGVFVNDFLIASFTCKVSQCFGIILKLFGAVQFYDYNCIRLLFSKLFWAVK